MSVPLTIALVPTELEDPVRETVRQGLRQFNHAHAGDANRRSLVLSATRDGDIVGGLVGQTAWRWLFIDLLWVDERHRGQGLGTQLVAAAELEARRRGCIGAHLDTFEFQARAFYEKLGYTAFGVQQNYPVGFARLFLQKHFADIPLEPANER